MPQVIRKPKVTPAKPIKQVNVTPQQVSFYITTIVSIVGIILLIKPVSTFLFFMFLWNPVAAILLAVIANHYMDKHFEDVRKMGEEARLSKVASEAQDAPGLSFHKI